MAGGGMMFDPELAVAGTVKLAEIDRLPGPQLRQAIPDNYLSLAADQRTLDMGCRISLKVVKIPIEGNHLVEHVDDIPLDIRVTVFVDGDSGGGVRNEYQQHPLCQLLLLEVASQQVVDIDHLHLFLGGYIV